MDTLQNHISDCSNPHAINVNDVTGQTSMTLDQWNFLHQDDPSKYQHADLVTPEQIDDWNFRHQENGPYQHLFLRK